MFRKLMIVCAFLLVAPAPALAGSGSTAPSARACISVETPPRAGGSLTAARSGPRSMVLCVDRATPSPFAVRTFVNAACRGELKLTRFAVRSGGGDYTTFAGCMEHKIDVATARLARALANGRQACSAEVGGVPAWARSGRLGYSIFIVDGRC